jgi:hypothetical protein
MPKYYFNVHNISPSVDDMGEELPDHEAAWLEATLLAGDIFKDIGRKFRPGQHWTVEVTDDAREPVYLIQIEGRQAK